jgi:5'-nucleotidase / UDP-sugar diphosphatase
MLAMVFIGPVVINATKIACRSAGMYSFSVNPGLSSPNAGKALSDKITPNFGEIQVMMKRYFLLFLLIPFICAGRMHAQPCDCKWPVDVVILHVNDMHAKIDNMAKLAYLADSLGRTCKYVFLVSAGDNFTGNPVVDMVADKGYPMIDLMNRCGFDVSAIGNHEFDLGQETLNRRFDQARFPFVSCNTDASGAVLEQPAPYTLLRAGRGNRIVFLGVTELGENGLPDSHPDKLRGLRFTEPLSAAKSYAHLKDRDILIALTHLGLDNDKRLADQVPQFDVIIGGHSHDRLDSGITENGVLITQAGSGLKFVGKTFIRLDRGRVVFKKEEMIPMAVLTRSDEKVQKLIDQYNTNEELSRVVGVAGTPLEGADELGSLMCDAMAGKVNADIAFQNRGGIRIPSLPKGDITLRDIYRLDPFGNKVVVFRMTAEEIRSLICYGFNLENRPDLEVSGMTYVVIQGADKKCSDVIMKDSSGNPLDPGREYVVAMNSYIASAYRFDHRDTGVVTDIGTAEALIGFLEQVKEVNYSGASRVSVKSAAP